MCCSLTHLVAFYDACQGPAVDTILNLYPQEGKVHLYIFLKKEVMVVVCIKGYWRSTDYAVELCAKKKICWIENDDEGRGWPETEVEGKG